MIDQLGMSWQGYSRRKKNSWSQDYNVLTLSDVFGEPRLEFPPPDKLPAAMELKSPNTSPDGRLEVDIACKHHKHKFIRAITTVNHYQKAATLAWLLNTQGKGL